MLFCAIEVLNIIVIIIIIMPNIDPYRYGCVKKSSTTHALVHLIHHWLNATEAPNTVIRSCLIDFSKAFDCIDHTILLHKLQLFNTPLVLLNCVPIFLPTESSTCVLTAFLHPGSTYTLAFRKA